MRYPDPNQNRPCCVSNTRGAGVNREVTQVARGNRQPLTEKNGTPNPAKEDTRKAYPHKAQPGTAGPQLNAEGTGVIPSRVNQENRSPRENSQPMYIRTVRAQDTETYTRGSRWRQPPDWISEGYAVRAPIVQQVLSKFEFTPEVDAFSGPHTNRFPVWWWQGSQACEDAYTRNWSNYKLRTNHHFRNSNE